MIYSVFNNKKFTPYLLILCFTSLLSTYTLSQNSATDSAIAKLDSIRKANRPRDGIKEFGEVITPIYSAKKGLFNVYQCRDTIYFEIPISILNRDIEVVNRLIKGPGGTDVYSGEELCEKTIQFERNSADSTIRIRYNIVISQADSNSDIFKAVMKSNDNPIVISFPIKAYGVDSTSWIIDVSKYLKDPNSFFISMDGSNLNDKVEAKKDISIDFIHSYPINVEIEISRNGVFKNLRGMPPNSPVTIVSHTSFVELPSEPLQQRIADPRIGYFADQVNVFGDHQQKMEDRRFILRWRLEPIDEDIQKWKNGGIVEPKKPIIIYIDPATPKQWRKYLIAGINDWQKAFEQAGFKNAIFGKEWPEKDTSMQMDDARYSFINYMPSELWNALGPNVHDPRSGEIIQTHIHWYHNVMQLLHEWYIIQAGATDPKARNAVFDEELMGQLIRFVSSHEVGHTLGLTHNWGASSQTPVDSLRSKHYLDIHGHTSSIMDYARFDYVAQPEDNIPEYDLFPRIGEYDKWAIEWGYRYSSAKTPEDDKKIMSKLISDSLSKNRRLWYGAQTNPIFDPRSQNEDLGDDAAKASMYGIKNLKRILPNLPVWEHEDDEEYQNLELTYKMLKNQFFTYMNQVLRNIGGEYTTLRGESQDSTVLIVGQKQVYAPVPIAKQKEALGFFDNELFTTPLWILDKNITQKVAAATQPDFVEDLQVKVLNSLLDIGKINKLLANMRKYGVDGYRVDEYISDIHKIIWKELTTGKSIEPYRRNLQKSYVGALADIMTSNKQEVTETDTHSIVRADMLKLQKEVHLAIPKEKENLSKYHLQDLENQIKNVLEAKRSMQ
ncbi:MAG TPA: zinc-dependent metalloprotease [Puia sp.]|jgi:hypothetical protein|nr:zinc-dependent metalloprotease [Puia sp.]